MADAFIADFQNGPPRKPATLFARRDSRSAGRQSGYDLLTNYALGLYFADQDHEDIPEDSALKEFVKSRLEDYTVEAVLLERRAAELRGAYVEVPEADLEAAISVFR